MKQLSKAMTAGLTLLLVAGTVAGSGQAQAASRRRRGRAAAASNAVVRKEFRLLPTAAGRALALSGKARTEARPARRREKITVEVQSGRLTPGSVLEIWLVNPANTTDWVFLSNITLVRNPVNPRAVRGEIELDTERGATLPAGASPVQRITQFRVQDPDTDEVLLTTQATAAPKGAARGGGADDPAGHDAGDDRGRGRGRR